MTLSVSLEPQKEAKLLEIARQKGVSADALVREAIDRMLATFPEQPLKPLKSAYGLLEKYGPGPSDEDIEENRREMFRSFGEDHL
jgi:hypothetical protein